MKKIIMAENQEFFSDVKIGAHHYAELFAKNGYEVLWLSPAFSFIHGMKKNSYLNKRKGLSEIKRHKLKDNIYGFAPRILIPFANKPIINSKFVGRNYLKTAFPNLKGSLKKIGFGEVDILWISNVKMSYLNEYVKADKVIHRLADEKKGFKGFYKSLEIMEEELLKDSDIVFATAENLVHKAKEFRDEVIYLPNGVNYSDFDRNMYIMPSEFIDNNKRVVYVGAIAEWLDHELINYCTNELPEVKFYFIGPGVNNNIEIRKNVYLLGKKNYGNIPDYIYNADVAIIPFKINELTDAINPVKLYEYLAVGTPVVTTNFKEVSIINGPFDIAKNKEQFLDMLKSNLFNSEYKVYELKEFASKNSWQSKFNIINEML
jgi:teichuronic acid biosynthesis glycosyltransferase TuaH